MDSHKEELQHLLIGGHFSEAREIAEHWLKSFSLDEKNSAVYQKAQEAYLYARFFLHRQDRVQSLPKGETRARTYLQFLQELEALRKENGFDSGKSGFWKSLRKYIHLQIAEGFARAFAGQKSYNLNDAEIIQLGVSLLILERWGSALDALTFLQRLQPANWLVSYLVAAASFHQNREREFSTNMRDALFYKPEILEEYDEFLPPGLFRKLWTNPHSKEEEKQTPREYALLLEINGLYRFKRTIQKNELKQLEEEFEQEYQTYRSNGVYPADMLPHLLHRLCWLTYSYKTAGNYEKFEEYRNIMMNLSPDSWETFQAKNLAE